MLGGEGGGRPVRLRAMCVCCPIRAKQYYYHKKYKRGGLTDISGPHGFRGAGVHSLAGLGLVGQGVCAGGLG